MAKDPALARETAVRAWLRTVPARERKAALARAAEGHGLRQRAAEANQTERDRGTWYTPPELVAAVLRASLTAEDVRAGRVCDPACGAGHFLLAVAGALRAGGRGPAEVACALRGCDIDPMAVAIARVRLQHEIGGTAKAWQRAVRCADALDARTDVASDGNFTLIVGNPPFLNQVRTRTAATRAEATALRERFGGAIGGYADVACAFLLLACELVAPGGRVALVLPMSVLATTDALPTRTAVDGAARITACLLPPSRVFGGGVPTAVPVFERRRERSGRAGRARGAGRESVRVLGVLGALPAAPVLVPARLVKGGAWSSLLAAARGIPLPRLALAKEPLAAIATATADFRQHYYGLRGCVEDLGEHARLPQPRRGAALAAVATVGSVDAARFKWALQRVRLHGHSYAAPVADLARLRQTPELASWATARLTPKVLVATQTRVLEAWVDARGAVLPSTPLISVMPRRRADLWRIAAVLLAPPVCAAAWWRHAGAALSAGALKLSARQVLELPVPAHRAAWDAAAEHVRAWHAAEAATGPAAVKERAIAREQFAQTICRAYGMRGVAERRALVDWWSAQLGSAK